MLSRVFSIPVSSSRTLQLLRSRRFRLEFIDPGCIPPSTPVPSNGRYEVFQRA
jgi:hypothetical protein